MKVRTLPNDISEEVLRRVLREHIDRFSEQTISVFQNLIGEDYEPSVERMDIGIDTYGIDDPYPTIYRYLEGKDKLITSKKTGNFAGDARDLEIVLSDLPEMEEEAFYEKYYASNLAEVCVTWAAECWWKAGGWDFHIPTRVFIMEGMTPPNVPQLTQVTAR